mmetsp:Transcript_91219/g.254763  ORF Transcript_91219/g.254763 Transcript_91219/m.254763 type:complete len:531 (-) Transcript_91219:303-1895(-)
MEAAPVVAAAEAPAPTAVQESPPAAAAAQATSALGPEGGEEAAVRPPARASDLYRPQYRGKVRSFNEQKGFGFIECQETVKAFGRDVFIHRQQMAEAGLRIGQDVIFEVELNKSGHPQARRVQPANPGEVQAMTWNNMSSGFGVTGGGWIGGGQQHSAGVGWNKGMGKGPHAYGGGNFVGGGVASATLSAAETAINESLRRCATASDIWAVIEQHGHSFGKQHVVTALYQLGLCRRYDRSPSHAQLISALIDRLMQFSPRDLSTDEVNRVLWAFATLKDVSNNTNAHRFVTGLGNLVCERYDDYTPAQMASLLGSLSKLMNSPAEDELVGRITTKFTDYALGNGSLPRFPPEELQTWTDFLQSVSSAPAMPPINPYMAPAMGMPTWPGKGLPGIGPFGGFGMPGFGPGPVPGGFGPGPIPGGFGFPAPGGGPGAGKVGAGKSGPGGYGKGGMARQQHGKGSDGGGKQGGGAGIGAPQHQARFSAQKGGGKQHKGSGGGKQHKGSGGEKGARAPMPVGQQPAGGKGGERGS